jgi:multiple sugar transport system permease protein
MTAFVLMAVFTTSGTFMLLFLAALQAIGEETEEAAMVDGATAWQRFWYVTLPMLRPTVFTVLTLGTIGTWQVFDQIYTCTRGGPAKTTLTPAYLSYDAAFLSQDWGRGAAIAFVLFGIIVLFTLLQRLVLGATGGDRSSRRLERAELLAKAKTTQQAAAGTTVP